MKAYDSENQCDYYYNTVSQKTQYEAPEGFALPEDQKAHQQAGSTPSQPLMVLQGFATRLSRLIDADSAVVSRSTYLSKLRQKQDEWAGSACKVGGFQLALTDLADI